MKRPSREQIEKNLKIPTLGSSAEAAALQREYLNSRLQAILLEPDHDKVPELMHWEENTLQCQLCVTVYPRSVRSCRNHTCKIGIIRLDMSTVQFVVHKPLRISRRQGL